MMLCINAGNGRSTVMYICESSGVTGDGANHYIDQRQVVSR